MSGHGGNLGRLAKIAGCSENAILDFSANINPLGPPEYLWDVLAGKIQSIVHYPDPRAGALTQKIAETYGVKKEQIIVGNGTSELLYAVARQVQCNRVIVPVPAYIDYRLACEQAGLAVHPLVLNEKDNFQPDIEKLAASLSPGDLVIIGQPNNPTGRLVERNQLLKLAENHPQVKFLVDEAFAGFIPEYASVACAGTNIIVLCSLTKLFAVPGLRLGFLASSEQFCNSLHPHLAPWSVNTLAQAAGISMLGDSDYIQKSCQLVAESRKWLEQQLSSLPMLKVIPAAVNFLLVRLVNKGTADELAQKLLSRHQIAIRVCNNYEGLDSTYFRIAVRTREENQRLVRALSAILQVNTGSKLAHVSKKTPALMFLGTGSDVGKSVLVAGLCRVLLQDGVRVAPFKAQNMSLNSYVTRDGGEMGRAQVVQAQACRLDPEVRMNPLLLKPNSDVGSQVIVHGQPVANMRVAEYVRYKEQAWQEVCNAYDSLAADFDCIILEGAGSPGEVNLKSHDIVNMRMAQYAQARALLVGDIDRGGVYASFVGHVEVMAPWERDLLAGFVVNRFRGDQSLLAGAHDFLERRTGRQVIGVVPFIHNLDLPQEDSVSFKAGLYDSSRPQGDHVEIALVDLPHISNFTDMEPLLGEPDVYLRIVRRTQELGTPDCIILPGSKNVVADLTYLAKSGLDKAILTLAEQGCEVVGICGGFQILGRQVVDPHGLEGEAGCAIAGLGLLPVDTELAAEKTLTRKEGTHLPTGAPVHGYEIHHGISQGSAEPLFSFSNGSSCGVASGNGKVWGCYLHGIFDTDQFRRAFINRLRHGRGLQHFAGQPVAYDLEPALDRLAEVLRQSLDMKKIYQWLTL
jgi:cobyric acid synthase CobQ/L-threonine-O-3-phosphate decarboxylase